MIFHLAYIFLLAVVSAIPSGRVDVVYPSLETSRSGVKTVKFRALDQDIELKLKPAGEILAKNFALVDENGQKYHSIDVENLRRQIYRDSANGAALLIDDEGSLTIQGIVNSKLRIEPYESGRMVKDGKVAHQIVEVINDKKSFYKDAVMPMDVKRETKNVARMARDDECIVLEYLCLTESHFTERFKTNEALTEYITVMYTGVQNLLDTLELGIKVRLLAITPFKKGSEPPFIDASAIRGYPQYLNPDVLLENMKNYICRHRNSLTKIADLIMLIVDRPLGELQNDGTVSLDTAGIAYTGAVCKNCSNVGVALDDSEYNERVDTVAHESTHLIGSPHDGEGTMEVGIPGSPGALDCPYDTGYIMGDRSNEDNKFKFSECSKKCVEYLLSLPSAACVYDDCEDF